MKIPGIITTIFGAIMIGTLLNLSSAYADTVAKKDGETVTPESVSPAEDAKLRALDARLEKADRVLDITYQDENYKVPENEIWKLTWKSPYQAGEIFPAYDVRVLGHCFTTREMGTRINAFSSNPGKGGVLDVYAGTVPAEIWIPSNTEFYLANDRIQVRIEVFKNKPLK